MKASAQLKLHRISSPRPWVGADRAADEAPCPTSPNAVRISSAAAPQISSTRSVDFVLARQGKDFVLLIMHGFAFSQ